jgi:hypothetical protein
VVTKDGQLCLGLRNINNIEPIRRQGHRPAIKKSVIISAAVPELLHRQFFRALDQV